MTQSENAVPVAHNQYKTDDLRITGIKEVIAPVQALEEFPITSAAADTVLTARREIQRILSGEDDRLLVIIGPCSIHDPQAAVDYGKKLLELKRRYAQDLLIATDQIAVGCGHLPILRCRAGVASGTRPASPDQASPVWALRLESWPICHPRRSDCGCVTCDSCCRNRIWRSAASLS